MEDDQKKEEQVELLRDRKTLDLESTLLKSRRSIQDSVCQRMINVSKASICQLQALPIQLPFHQYEEEVISSIESRIPSIQTNFIEIDNKSSNSLFSPTSLSLNTFSPNRNNSPTNLK